MKKPKPLKYNGREVTVKQETEHYYLVYFANDYQQKLFSIKKEKDENTN